MKKVVIIYFLLTIIPCFMIGCASQKPTTDEEFQQDMQDLDLYMLSHGHQPSNHQ
jgi:hypothetical protein